MPNSLCFVDLSTVAEIQKLVCPDCGAELPAGSAGCACGHLVEFGRKPLNPGTWLILLRITVIAGATAFAAYQFATLTRVSRAVTPDGGSSGKSLDCVETYGITLHTSEFYVRELGSSAAPRPKNAPPELSTVIRGMARNGCGKRLNNVRIRIKVRDEAGNRGDSWAYAGTLEPGEAKPFERAWMSRVVAHEIVEIR